MLRCKMCDFRRSPNEGKTQLANISGCIFTGDERQELDYMVGELQLEKSLNSYNAVITVSGVNENTTVCTIIKIPVNIYPNCGRVLRKGSVNVYVSKE